MCACMRVRSELLLVPLAFSVLRNSLALLDGRACALRLSVVCTECIMAKRCVLSQKLLLTAYMKSYIMRNRLLPK